MSHVVDNHLLVADLIYDQVIADGKHTEPRFSGRNTYQRHFRYQGGDALDAAYQPSRSHRVVARDIGKYLVKITKGTATVAKPHAPR